MPQTATLLLLNTSPSKLTGDEIPSIPGLMAKLSPKEEENFNTLTQDRIKVNLKTEGQ